MLASLVVTTSRNIPFKLLTPVVAPPRLSNLSILEGSSPSDLSFIFTERISPTDPMALDVETRGGDPSDPDSQVVGVGLSDSRGSVYIDIVSAAPGTYEWLLEELLTNNIPLVAHNLFFDASYVMRDSGGKWHNWQHCTYALYKLLATEGFNGQKWGLKNAQTDLLGWEESNEKELSQWLVDNGYGTKIVDSETGETILRPSKGEMWRAPASILGHYCALDADSTYLLYTQVLLPALQKYRVLQEYAGPVYMDYLQILIQQRFSGIAIDRSRLLDYDCQLESTIAQLEKDFLAHPSIAPLIAEWNQMVVDEHLAKEPERYLKKKLGKEPAQYKKDGTVSTNWLKWKQKADAPLVESKNWLKWALALDELKKEQHFNINSNQQKQWLFYTKLGNAVTLTTESGQPATDEKALKGFGEPGRILIGQNEAVKEKGYVEAVLQHSKGGTLHPAFKVPGTLTGRLAGAGGLNVQQMPKSKEFLSCWVARPGHVWVQMDFTALEQVVLAELSRDPALWKLYGPGAPKNDVYLFTGSQLPKIGKVIQDAGYDPNSPTPEGIASAKKQAKKERGIAKVITLASSYGAGPGKIHQTLRLEGVPISLEECRTIHAGYWELYAGVKEYEKELLRQLNNNNGWVLNGLGRPLGIAPDLEKDIVNRVVQSTGHDILVQWVTIYSRMLQEAGIPFAPIIADLHDESIIEVPESYANEALWILTVESMQVLNRQLGGRIPLKGEGMVAHCLADIKIEG
jgi:DNA polymerase I-like protein with 3'-5' exonuclease and polymerase domains